MNDKLLSMLGMCRKAGRISMGHDASIASIKNKKARLCLLCCDLSERAMLEYEKAAENYGRRKLKVIRTKYSMSEIQMALGKKAGAITINDEGFAVRILEILNSKIGEE